MFEEEYTRLGEIEREYESMGLSSKWVDEYTRMRTCYPDPATDMPFHNGNFLMLPEGTMPHDVYMQKLTSLTEDLEKAENSAREARRFNDAQKDEYIRCYGKAAYEQDMSRRKELNKQQLARPSQIEQELRVHLFNFKPIKVRDFHKKIRTLSREQIRIKTNIRITEATMMIEEEKIAQK
jgi:hypothetical protein